jgi:hypothetical protein
MPVAVAVVTAGTAIAEPNAATSAKEIRVFFIYVPYN